MAVSRMHVGRLVLVRMEPRKEFLVVVSQYTYGDVCTLRGCDWNAIRCMRASTSYNLKWCGTERGNMLLQLTIRRRQEGHEAMFDPRL
jgi:hypothetical protein